jgi:hypothetical protein
MAPDAASTYGSLLFPRFVAVSLFLHFFKEFFFLEKFLKKLEATHTPNRLGMVLAGITTYGVGTPARLPQAQPALPQSAPR